MLRIDCEGRGSKGESREKISRTQGRGYGGLGPDGDGKGGAMWSALLGVL